MREVCRLPSAAWKRSCSPIASFRIPVGASPAPAVQPRRQGGSTGLGNRSSRPSPEPRGRFNSRGRENFPPIWRPRCWRRSQNPRAAETPEGREARDPAFPAPGGGDPWAKTAPPPCPPRAPLLPPSPGVPGHFPPSPPQLPRPCPWRPSRGFLCPPPPRPCPLGVPSPLLGLVPPPPMTFARPLPEFLRCAPHPLPGLLVPSPPRPRF